MILLRRGFGGTVLLRRGFGGMVLLRQGYGGMIPLRQFHSEFISAPGCPILAAGKGGAFSGSSDAEEA